MDFFSFLLPSYLFFEKCLKKNSKKIMKSDMGIPCGYSRALWPHTSTPDKQLNRQVFDILNFIVRI